MRQIYVINCIYTHTIHSDRFATTDFKNIPHHLRL